MIFQLEEGNVMSQQPFQNLTDNQATDYPKITTNRPLSLFYKRKNRDKVLYTMVTDQHIDSFEATDYQILHRDHDFELMYVLNGRLTNVFGDKEFIFSAGDACLLNPQMAHFERLESKCSVVFLNLSVKLLNELFNDLTVTGPLFNFLKQSLRSENDWQQRYIQFTKNLPTENTVVKILFDSLQQELATNKLGKYYLQKGLVLRLLAAFENSKRFTLKEFDLDASKEAYLVNRVIYQIEHHYGNITRQKLEQALHYNAEYLNRLLKRQTGKTISNYAQLIRLKNAKNLLTTTDLTIQLIAEKLGFRNETYFYQFFKKQTQSSPNKYRKNKKQTLDL